MSSSPSEYEIHCSIVAYLDVALPASSICHHSPNEGRHHIAYRKKQHRLGMKAGWPDLEVLIPRDNWHGNKLWGPIYFEIKSEKGKLSKNQKNIIKIISATGGYCFVVRSIDEVIACLTEILGVFPNAQI